MSNLPINIKNSHNLPKNSRIKLSVDTDNTLSISLLKRGYKKQTDTLQLAVILITVTLMSYPIIMILSIIVCTTSVTCAISSILNSGDLFLIALSIYLLYILAIWAKGAIIDMIESQTITFKSDNLSIAKQGLIFTSRKKVPYTKIDSVSIDRFLSYNPIWARFVRPLSHKENYPPSKKPDYFRKYRRVRYILPTIQYGWRKVRFAENMTEQEMKWLIYAIKDGVRQKRKGH